MRYADFYECDICNGNEVGMTLFIQGCPFHCKGCFNPETWDFNGGKEWTPEVEEKFMEMISRDYIHRISFLGGSPLCDENIEDVWKLIYRISHNFPEKQIWVYTGFRWEDIYDKYDDPPFPSFDVEYFRKDILCHIDILVDGSFECDNRDLTLPFRGSTNQRIIDVKKSIELGEVVLWCRLNVIPASVDAYPGHIMT